MAESENPFQHVRLRFIETRLQELADNLPYEVDLDTSELLYSSAFGATQCVSEVNDMTEIIRTQRLEPLRHHCHGNDHESTFHMFRFDHRRDKGCSLYLWLVFENVD